MNDFWSDLSAAVKKAASDVSTEVSIAAKEQKLKEEFQTLGRMYYKARKKGAELESTAFAAQIEKINLLMQEISYLRDSKHVPSAEDFVDMT